MVRNVASTVENNFSGGLITDAGVLSFPEHAVADCDNMHFTLSGDAVRRLGFNAEAGAITPTSEDFSDQAIVSYLWQSVNGDGDINFVVLQIGRALAFFFVNPNAPLSQGLVGNIQLPLGLASAQAVQENPCQFTSGNGFLFVTHRFIDPIYVRYDVPSNTFFQTAINVQIRDLIGVIDQGWNGQAQINSNPSGLTSQHRYNLLNQGWTDQYINTFKNQLGTYPSNSTPFWIYLDASNLFNPTTQLANGTALGTQQSPKGSFFLNPFFVDRSTIAGQFIENVQTSNPERPQTCCFFAGRLFMAGVNAVGYNNSIYFSQIIQSPDDYRKCYQTNDPSAQVLNEILVSDGGVIQIQDAGRIIKMISLQGAIAVFCTNGVWVISGSIGTGFTATDYSIRKISGVKTLSSSSFVSVLGTPYWWAQDGIYTMQADSLGTFKVTSITLSRVNDYFSTIDNTSKLFAVGDYNDVTKEIQWFFRTAIVQGFEDNYIFDSALIYNTLTNSFSTWSFDLTASAVIKSPIVIQGTSNIQTTLDVVDLTLDQLVTSDGSTVTVIGSSAQSLPATFKYFVRFGNDMTVAEENDANYEDFHFVTGVGTIFESQFLSGPRVHGDAQKKFQANYVVVVCDNSQNNSFYIAGVWDYANNGSTGRWSTPQLCSSQNSNYTNRYFKRKLRGQGISLQYQFTASDNKPMSIVGWSAFETGNAVP